MLAAAHLAHQKEIFDKIKMEEQTVPSAGFSPQPETYESDYMSKYPNYGPIMAALDDSSSSYGNLADTFDLSLLGDAYDDHDMATVPSPSWSPSGCMELTSWQQMSLYAASPSGDYRAFSPECSKAGLSPVHPFSGDSYGGNLSCHSPATPILCNMNMGASPSAETGNGNGNGSSGGSPSAAGNPLAAPDNLPTCERHLLLRQCLEDTSFQRKYNFKPLDLPSASLLGDADSLAMREIAAAAAATTTSSSVSDSVVGSSLELNQIEPVFSLAFEHIRSDIQNICNNLAISPDPMQWSGSDVHSWLTHTLSTLTGGDGTTNADLRQFRNFDGRTLCTAHEEEFRRRDPVNGDRIFANLELWKMVQGKSPSASQMSSVGMSEHNSSVDNNAPLLQQSLSSQQVLDLEELLLMPGSSASALSHSPVSSPQHIIHHDVKVKVELSSSVMDAVVRSPSSSSSSFQSPAAPEVVQTDDEMEEDQEEEEEKPVVITTTKGKSGAGGSGSGKSGAHIHLWQFLKELLGSPQQHGSCIRWLDQSRGVFKIEDSVRVARLWGLRKNRPAMNYDKLSRSIRQYYRKGIMRKTERSQRLVYQFCHPYGL